VVGIFQANGGVAETEVWGDARTLQSAYRRGNTYQSVLVQLDSINAFDAFRDWLTANPQVKVGIRRESEYYAAQSAGMTRLIRSIGFGIGALMGIGAVFGAVLTMYTVVATRAREDCDASCPVLRQYSDGSRFTHADVPSADRTRTACVRMPPVPIAIETGATV
jgi:hypothetical protein